VCVRVCVCVCVCVCADLMSHGPVCVFVYLCVYVCVRADLMSQGVMCVYVCVCARAWQFENGRQRRKAVGRGGKRVERTHSIERTHFTHIESGRQRRKEIAGNNTESKGKNPQGNHRERE